jgi:hypothetical protein
VEDEAALNSSKNGPITHQLIQSIHKDLRKTFVYTTTDWERQNYGDIIVRLSQLDKSINKRNKRADIRVVQVPSVINHIIHSAEERPGECHYFVISGHWQ